MAKRYMTLHELSEYFKERYSAADLAKAANITTQGAYNLMYAKTNPRKSVLDDLNIRIMYEVQK